MVVKNYKAMCELLGEKEKNGHSKESQLKKWQSRFHWIKDGHKFIIKEIYDEPLPIEDGRSEGNNAIYVRLIEWLIAKDLVKREGYTHTLTRKRWWKLLGMVNSRYHDVSSTNLHLISELHDDKEIRWFYNRSNSILNNILRDALRSMCNRSLIDYEIQTIIVRPESEGGWFQAGDEELAKLQEIRRDTLNKMGLAGERQVFYKNRQDEYYKEVYRIIKDEYGWDRYFKQIKIIFNQKNISKAIPELEEDFRNETMRSLTEDKMLKLNEEIVNRMNTDAENQFNKTIENVYHGKSTFLFPVNYLEAQKSLTYYLIDLKSMVEDISIKKLVKDDFQDLDDLFIDSL